jgi:hypothetical protein
MFIHAYFAVAVNLAFFIWTGTFAIHSFTSFNINSFKIKSAALPKLRFERAVIAN